MYSGLSASESKNGDTSGSGSTGAEGIQQQLQKIIWQLKDDEKYLAGITNLKKVAINHPDLSDKLAEEKLMGRCACKHLTTECEGEVCRCPHVKKVVQGELVVFLNDYIVLTGHLFAYETLLNEEINEEISLYDKFKQGTLISGILSGELASLVLRLIKALIPKLLMLSLVANYFLYAVIISYVFYAVAALFSFGISMYKLLRRNNSSEHDVLPPHNYTVSNTLAAVANFFVCALYLTTALVFAHQMPILGLWMNPVGYGLATAGTVIGWLGNNFMDYWRANYELGKLENLKNPLRSEPLIENQKIKCEDKKFELLHSVTMIFVMGFLTLISLGSVVPLLASSTTFFTFGCTLSMAFYVAPYVIDGAKWLYSKCCCKQDDSTETSKKPRSPVSDNGIRGQLQVAQARSPEMKAQLGVSRTASSQDSGVGLGLSYNGAHSATLISPGRRSNSSTQGLSKRPAVEYKTN